jgi:glycosyltransferase involved in cell wall biosynthesis
MTDDASTVTAPAPAPPLSVAIAAFDAGPFLVAAVRSALAQDPAPVEVVVCDDGSTDGSVEALAVLGEQVRVVRHDVNRGESAAKNTAVRATTTDVVVLLDADDEFLPGRLAALGAAFAADEDVDIVTTDAFLVHDGQVLGRWYTPTHRPPGADQRRSVLSRNPVFGHPAVRRRAFDAVGGFDVDVPFAADWDCWIRMVLAGSRIAVVEDALSLYRVHESNSSGNRLAMAEGRVEILRRTATRPDLSSEERQLVYERMALQQRLANRERIKAALALRGAAVRPAAWAVVRDGGQPARSRAAAAAALLLPGPAHAWWQRREATHWTGPGGRRVRRSGSAAG